MEAERTKLIETLRDQGIKNQAVLDCIAKIPRHFYVNESYRHQAYWNRPLPINEGQTISQPYIVAFMTETLLSNFEKVSNKKVLEIGTGSGYQSAVLSRLYETVYTVERIHTLMVRARRVNQSFDIENILYKNADRRSGWPEDAPFDGIIVTAKCETVPNLLVDQLKVGANLIVPIGPKASQILYCIKKTEHSYNQKALCAVSFVPMLEGLC